MLVEVKAFVVMIGCWRWKACWSSTHK